MRLFLSIAFFVASIFCCHAQQTSANIDALLREIGAKDQQARQNLNNAVRKAQVDSIALYAEAMQLIDQANQLHVKKILRGGVPDDLSREAYKALFLVIDHADIKYQKSCFSHLRKLSTKGHINPHDIATLKDRILMNSGRKQLYGTQTKARPIVIIEGDTTPQMVNYVWAVRDPQRLEARRKSVGLGTMQQQADAHKKVGHEMIFDANLSKKEINALTSSKIK